MAIDLRSSELEHSFVKERIQNVERHFSDISSKLSNYSKKLMQLRASADELAKCIYSFASKENLNQSLQVSLLEFTDIFAVLQDYRNDQIHHIDAKVVTEFSNYDAVCKKAKEQLKRNFEAHAAELKKQSQLEKMKAKFPSNLSKILKAEKEVNLAHDEAVKTSLEFSKRIESFEKKKLHDVKLALLEFLKIELLFNTKAIELHTNAYNAVKNINVEEDLNEFKCYFKALTSSLDADCLSNPDEFKKNASQTDIIKRNHFSFSMPNEEVAQKQSITTEIESPKLSDSNSCLLSTSESKFDFCDYSL